MGGGISARAGSAVPSFGSAIAAPLRDRSVGPAMEISRPIQVAGGIAAIGVAVLLMIPPTKPVTAAPTPHAFGKVQPPAPLPAVYPDYAPLPPAPQVDPGADDAASPPQAAEDHASRTASLAEPVDPGSQFYAGADSDADFDRGYRWAAARALEDPNRCMRWPDAPQVEGCLAYVRDAAGRVDPTDPEGRYRPDEEQ